MGRKPECSKCGKLKEPGRDNESCCKKCKSEMRSARAAKKRADAGFRPWGSGRNPNCSICGTEVTSDHSHCDSCRRQRANAAYDRKFSDPEEIRKRREARRYQLETDIFARKKKTAQMQAWRAVNYGLIDKKPCEICGEMKVDAHHDDYDKPLEVRFLCRRHHREHHERNNSLEREDYLGES